MDNTQVIPPTRYSVVSWANIDRLPEHPAERERFRYDLGLDLLTEFDDWLTIYGLANNPDSFDKFIIEFAAERKGARLLICDHVVQRLIEWEYYDIGNGDRKLRQFFAAMNKGAQLFRGKGRGTTTGLVEVVRQKALLAEVKILRTRLRVKSMERNQEICFADALQIMERDPASFETLLRSRDTLENMYANQQGTVDDFLQHKRGAHSPAEFVAAFMAWGMKRNAKKLRNDFSALRTDLQNIKRRSKRKAKR